MKQKDKTRLDKKCSGNLKKNQEIAGALKDASSGRESESCVKRQPVITPLIFLTKSVKMEMKAMTTNR